MGAWGTGLFSDDLALDVKGAYRELIADGATAAEAKAALINQFKDDQADPDTGPVFWLALAATAWKLGRLDDDLKSRALGIIQRDEGLELWDTPDLRRRRKLALAKVAEQLSSPQRTEVHVKKPKANWTDWQVGEVIGLRTLSEDWILLHVANHLNQGQDRYPVCEMLSWRGKTLPPSQADVNAAVVVNLLPNVQGVSVPRSQRFVLMDSCSKSAKSRLQSTGLFRKTRTSLFARLFQKKAEVAPVGTSYLGLAVIDIYLQKSSASDLPPDGK